MTVAIVSAVGVVLAAVATGMFAYLVERLRRENRNQHAAAGISRTEFHVALQQQLTTLHASMAELHSTFARHADEELGRYDKIMDHIVHLHNNKEDRAA